jgi:hypothetical protein
MHLNAVFLVGPEPERPAPPTVSRRMFVGALASSFGLGALLGAGLGSPAVDAPIPAAPPSKALAWALELQDGPLEGLVRNEMSFRIVVQDEGDPRLLTGVERLLHAVLNRDPTVEENRAALAASLASDIRTLPICSSLTAHVPELLRIR